ncbi:WD40 repeat-like protein [Obba rivulosa]|uniref:WD40 repeat-like protein n=1 Tax=Obba rivulosa TaxID=1052685 RepID=A0A8E2ASY1_9APHY|nr:WD40 repeat-like protein [Obba rivulosa]
MSSAADTSNFLRAESELIVEDARRKKAERTKDLGSPIRTSGKALAIQIRGNEAWIAENTSQIRRLNLETGKTLQTLKGHTAPATSLAFFDKPGGGLFLITGSWDKSIKVWNAATRSLISFTPAHADFVKTLLVIPKLQLLVSGSSDKIVRLWDLSTCENGQPLTSVGSISAHTRPVECLDARMQSDSSAILYTADTMGIIKVWELTREATEPPRWRSKLLEELKHHRTRINEIVYGNGELWTGISSVCMRAINPNASSASSDDTVQIVQHPAPPSSRPIPPLTHPAAVKAILPLSLTVLAEPYLITGAADVIRTYDVSSPEEPELLSEVDAHWHDVTALRLWLRRTPVEGADSKVSVEPWIISTSLDGTIRKWRLSELLKPPPPKPAEVKETSAAADPFQLTEEEERELAELMGSDED